MIFALPVNNRLLAGSAGVTDCTAMKAKCMDKMHNKHYYEPALAAASML